MSGWPEVDRVPTERLHASSIEIDGDISMSMSLVSAPTDELNR